MPSVVFVASVDVGVEDSVLVLLPVISTARVERFPSASGSACESVPSPSPAPVPSAPVLSTNEPVFDVALSDLTLTTLLAFLTPLEVAVPEVAVPEVAIVLLEVSIVPVSPDAVSVVREVADIAMPRGTVPVVDAAPAVAAALAVAADACTYSSECKTSRSRRSLSTSDKPEVGDGDGDRDGGDCRLFSGQSTSSSSAPFVVKSLVLAAVSFTFTSSDRSNASAASLTGGC